MKKTMIALILLVMLVGCGTATTKTTTSKVTYVKLSQKVTLQFFSVTTCSECKAFKKNAIPYLKKKFGSMISIKMHDLDADATKKPYDAIIKSLKNFDQEYYGMGPFYCIKGYFAMLGYTAGDEKYLAQDIIAATKGKTLGEELEGNRMLYK